MSRFSSYLVQLTADVFQRFSSGSQASLVTRFSRAESSSSHSFMSRQSVLAFLLVFLTTFAGVGNAWGGTYTYDFTKGSSTSYWTSNNSSGSVGTSNIESFYYMQSGYSGHHFTAGNGSTSTHNHKFNTNNNQQCFFLGKTGEYLTLPTYANEKITSIKIWGNSQGSSSAKVNIYSGTNAASTASAIYNTNHTFSISSTYQSSELMVKVTNNYNAGITKIEITTESSGSSNPANYYEQGK